MTRNVLFFLKVGLIVLLAAGAVMGTASHAFAAPAHPISAASLHTPLQRLLAASSCTYTCLDGKSVGTCANDEQKRFDRIFPSQTTAGRNLYELWLFWSPSCQAGWSAIANRSGVSLTQVSASARGSSRDIWGYVLTSPLANGAHLSSPLVGVKPGQTLWGDICADDIGISGPHPTCAAAQVTI